MPKRLMVIFGAGASFDSGTPSERDRASLYRPPLTNELFNPTRDFAKLLTSFPDIAPIVPEIRRAIEGTPHLAVNERHYREPSESLEQVLARIQASGSRMELKALEAARLYIREAIDDVTTGWWRQLRGVTLYAELVMQLDKWREKVAPHWRITFTTFNYDELLDKAMVSAGLLQVDNDPHDYSKGFVSDGHQPPLSSLYKPHGSVNWWQSPQGEMKVVDSGKAPQMLSSGWTPMLAIPVESKPHSDLAWTPVTAKRFTREATEAAMVLVIGWRASEVHFMKTWADSMPLDTPIRVASADGTATTVQNLKELGGFTDVAPVGFSTDDGPYGFCHFMDAGGWTEYAHLLITEA